MASGKEENQIEPDKEAIKAYLFVGEEIKIIRGKFLHYVRVKEEKIAKTYASILKDYRGIQVKFLERLAAHGVKNSEEDLAVLLSGLPEFKCDVKDCVCEYHKTINEIIETNSKK